MGCRGQSFRRGTGKRQRVDGVGRDTGLQRGSHTTLGVEEVSLRTQEDESKRGAKTNSLCLDLIYSLDKHLGLLAMLQALAWSFTGEFSGCGGGTDKVSH